MPYLDLTPEQVGPQRTRLVLSYIENLMLWPHDERKRTQAHEAAKGQFLLDSIKAWPEPGAAVEVSVIGELVEIALQAPPLAQVRGEAETPFRHGAIAGWLLAEMLRRSATDPVSAKLEAIKAEVVDRLRQPGLSASTINNTILPRYRPVQHLWAAYISGRDPSSPSVFPCRLGDLPTFLATAEVIRLEAETTVPPRRSRDGGKELLPPGIAWAVPPHILLPQVTLKWRPGYRADCSSRA